MATQRTTENINYIFNTAYEEYGVIKILLECINVGNPTTSSSYLTINVKMSMSSGGSGYGIAPHNTQKAYITVDGKQYSFTVKNVNNVEANTYYTIGTIAATNTVQHDSEGYRLFSISAQIFLNLTRNNFESYNPQLFNLGEVDREFQLNRFATITSAPDFNDEGKPTIKYYNPLGNLASAVNVGIANSIGTMIIPYREVSAVGSSYTFNFTDAERNILRNASKNSNSMTVKFFIETVYNGKSYYSNVSKKMSIVNANPVITATVKDTNSTVAALTGDSNKLIRYYSDAQITVNTEGQKGAVINLDTMVIRNGNRTAYSSPANFNDIESGAFTVSVSDSRSNVGTATISFPIVEYILLTCNLERAELDTAGVLTVDCAGNCFNQSFGAVYNDLIVQCRYKPQDGEYSSWMNMSVSKYENTYTASMDISGLNYREKYVIQCRAVDKLNTASTPEVVVKSLPVFHWSENDFVFEVPVVFNAGASGADIESGGSSGSSSGIIEGNATIGGDCVINGDLRLKGSGNYGNTLYFGDGSYAMISEPSDDTLTIKATTLNLNGNTVNLNGYPIGYGTWIPTLNNSSAVSSYGVRQGWYSRMGNVITIGWQLKATINSGYSTTSLSINGAPFVPAYAAFGGGVAHNINVSAGFVFEGWTIGTDGAISARMQPCNGTSAGNLQISSTAYYPTGSGNTLTLAGTICYVIN
jgi:hypothetical protein